MQGSVDPRFAAGLLAGRGRSQSPDLPPPHGLAPSETMVSDHGLRRPLSRENLEIKGFLGLQRPFLDLVSQTPRPRGRGRPLFAEKGHQNRPPSL